jgi:hypothetical protein
MGEFLKFSKKSTVSYDARDRNFIVRNCFRWHHPAYSTWIGGVLGVLQRQLDDFNDFHDRWCLDDMTNRL